MSDEPGLIQQRIALGRARNVAIVRIAFPAVLALILGIGQLSRGVPSFLWLPLAGMAVYGVVHLVSVERRRRRFVAEHGRDAGQQMPVRR
ncbi:hypothetical protein B5808_19465 (plasmid) [Cnuibacter physcomitrellae]|uniref:Uncharacterized protein n=1 Tax=Cnuibacter physcomitrellae TaxID=1619308 RepID=A0A1X9LR25_9MICO|nr:hypothetical protein [Cnuibacter physcomitrellae]ARJ07577.1 hypothetical protein B5808_19465 [Cnuibacter physcomitrellae]